MRKNFFVKNRKKDKICAKTSGKRKSFSNCEFATFEMPGQDEERSGVRER